MVGSSVSGSHVKSMNEESRADEASHSRSSSSK